MRLIFDLRLSAAPPPDGSIDRYLTLGDAVDALRSPVKFARLLWGARYDEVRIERDDVPLNGVQSMLHLIAATSRGRRFVVSRPADEESFSRGKLLVQAFVKALVSVPGELFATYRVKRRADRIAKTNFDLPARAGNRHTVVYMRCEPSLLWRGAFIGGAATHTSGVINGLADNGVRAHVFAADPIPGIEPASFTRVVLRRVLHVAHWMTFTEYSEDLVDAALSRPDSKSAGFVYQRYALGSYAGLELARKLNVPLVLEFNGSEIWAEKNWGTGTLRFLDSLSALEQRNLLDATLIIVVSDVLKDQLVEAGVEPSRVLANPNGVEVEKLAPIRAKTAAQWRGELGLPDAPTVGFIGTFGLWHGVKLLPAMIAALKQQIPDARWVLIGGGALHGEVAAEIERLGLSDRVELTGTIGHDEAVRYLAACDVCVSPHVPNPDGSKFFGSPTKLFEYMGLGKPIVASDLDQIGEVIEHERTGLLCPPGDVEASAGATARLLRDPELAKQLGDAALAEAEERYSWKAHVSRILQAIPTDADR